jgi:site-specific DNA-methyltransferase (adenine-specific)
MKDVEIYNDNFQNFKPYGIPHAQLIIADPPFNLGNAAYASNPSWYKGGDNKNGESELAGKEFFDTDKNFRPAEFMHFCSQMLVKEPKQGMTDEEYEQAEKIGGGSKVKSKAPCMLLFCGFDQMSYYIELGKRYGFMHYIPLVFRKNYSAQVLKANMKIVGNCEYGLVLYKDKLPKFNNHGKMVMNCIDYPRDNKTPRVHPTQKSVPLLEFLIGLFTDVGDVVIDPCAGSGTSLLAAGNLGRKAYGFEIKKEFYNVAKEKILPLINQDLFTRQEMDERDAKRWQQKNMFDENNE